MSTGFRLEKLANVLHDDKVHRYAQERRARAQPRARATAWVPISR